MRSEARNRLSTTMPPEVEGGGANRPACAARPVVSVTARLETGTDQQ